MLFSIITGYSLGSLLAFFLSRSLLGIICRRYATRQEQERFIKVMGGILGAISLAPGMFLTVILGGYLERNVGVLAEAYSALSATAQWLVPFLGLIIITAATVTLAAGMGGLLGVMLARSLFPDRRPPA